MEKSICFKNPNDSKFDVHLEHLRVMLGYSLKSILSFLYNKWLIPHIVLFIPHRPAFPPRDIPFLLSAIPPVFLNEVSGFFSFS